MADPNFSWIYLIIFLAIPLARIIPRLLARRKMKNDSSQTMQDREFQPSFDEYSEKPQQEFSKPQTKIDCRTDSLFFMVVFLCYLSGQIVSHFLQVNNRINVLDSHVIRDIEGNRGVVQNGSNTGLN